jgi:hypothetical protein
VKNEDNVLGEEACHGAAADVEAFERGEKQRYAHELGCAP